MAASPTVGNAVAIAACDAVVDKLDAGGSAGVFNIYSGTRPDRADVAITDQTLLVSITLNDPAFGAAVDDSTNNAAAATLDIDPALSAVASNTNTATFFRSFDSDGNVAIDGSVGTSGADAIIDSTSIVSGATVNLLSWVFRVGEGTAA